MLTCIACSKRLNGGSLHEHGDADAASTDITPPGNKQPIKTITAQIKDMAVKASGAYKNCRPCSGSSNHKNYDDSDAGSVSERFYCSYRRTGGSNSTPGIWGKEMEGRLKALSSGEGTPAPVSGRTESVVFVEEDEPKEWVAQVEPGVLITFVLLPQGGNDLRRIRFSREMFNKWQAQRWWSENHDKVMELYDVQGLNCQGVPLPSSPRSDDESSKTESIEDSPVTPPLKKECRPHNLQHQIRMEHSSSELLSHNPTQFGQCCDSGLASTPRLSSSSGARKEASLGNASARTSSSSREADNSGELSISNASDLETEWVEQDEPGVYITIRALPGGTRELRRVRFSREKFGEMQAKLWWEANRARIQRQYM